MTDVSTTWTCPDLGVDELRSELEALLATGCPDRALLAAIGKRLRAAEHDTSDEYHELVDPDRFWYDVAWPRAVEVAKRCGQAIDEWAAAAADQLVQEGAMLTDVATKRAWETADAAVGRTGVIDDVVSRCEALHAAIEAASLEELDRSSVDEIAALLHDERLRAGTEREQELRLEIPWRHQELLIEAHRQAHAQVAEALTAATDDLTGRLMPMGERVIATYDESVR